jgi:hypothetical protein
LDVKIEGLPHSLVVTELGSASLPELMLAVTCLGCCWSGLVHFIAFWFLNYCRSGLVHFIALSGSGSAADVLAASPTPHVWLQAWMALGFDYFRLHSCAMAMFSPQLRQPWLLPQLHGLGEFLARALIAQVQAHDLAPSSVVVLYD